jgi:GTPase KRas protein
MIEVLDTASQEEYTSLQDEWIRDGESVMLLYSTTSKSSFDRLGEIYNRIQRTKNDGKFPIVVVGNKSDLADQRQVSEREGLAFANKVGCRFVESSAKTSLNVQESFFHLVRETRRYRTQPITRRLSVDFDALGQLDNSRDKSRQYRAPKSLN